MVVFGAWEAVGDIRIFITVLRIDDGLEGTDGEKRDFDQLKRKNEYLVFGEVMCGQRIFFTL